MTEALKFLLPVFSTSKTYGETLSKLAGFALYETYILTFILRRIPQVDEPLRLLERPFNLDHAFNPAGIAIALCVALLSRAFKLHDRISDLLGIRRRFDVTHILLPLASKVGFQPNAKQIQAIRKKRSDLMRAVFYKYASSRADNPLVDKHDIEHAIDSWSWFWWPVEGIIFLLAAFLIALVFGYYGLASGFAVTSIVFSLIALGLYLNLKKLARPQVEAIAADGTAKSAVLAQFNAL